MALTNGVLVHGPTAWACAVRTADGSVKIASERKRLVGSQRDDAAAARPGTLVEAFAVLPRVKRALPEAKMPFEGRTALDGDGRHRARHPGSAPKPPQRDGPGASRRAPCDRAGGAHRAQRLACRLPRRRAHRDRQLRARPPDREGARTLRLASRRAADPHGATAGNLLAARAPSEVRPAARLAASLGAVAAATEIFGWMTATSRPPARPRTRAARPRASAPALRRPSRARISSRSHGRRSRPASSSKTLDPLAL